ncbi:MAG: DUF3365 domain-containing protein [Deltaproteobacteria bacterium]|nr:DUF3365 domain-containing protein [Deltaproteobacteria bacterium]
MNVLSRLKTSYVLAIGTAVVFLLLTALVLLLVNQSMKQQALLEAEAKARILLDRNMAVHTYFSHILKPRLFEWTEPFRPPDYFDPAWMSSTYAIREIHKYFAALNSETAYYVKDAAIDARSPENEADAFERAFLEQLNRGGKQDHQAEVRQIDGKPFLTVLRKGEVLEESCLRCHSRPENAPQNMFAFYSRERSFNRHSGEVASAISLRIPLADAYQGMYRAFWKTAIVLAAVLAVLFIIQLYLYRRFLTKPLAMLRDKAVEIAGSREHLGETIPQPAVYELRELADAFNDMSAKLRAGRDRLEERVLERTRELHTANNRLQKEVRERTQAEAEVSRLNNDLERLVRERTAQLESTLRELESFSYSVSHDLRSPLRAIDGYGYTLLDEYADKPLDEQGRRYLERIRKGAQRMGNLIDDMIEMAQVTRARFSRQPVDLSRLVRKVAEKVRQSRPGQQVEVRIEEGLVADCDPDLMRIALWQLMDNAWKFTAAVSHPKIEFGRDIRDGKQVFFLKDNGVGFDMVYASKIFTAFQTLHPFDEYPGTGVGLAVVQRIIRRHEGDIRAEGEVGGGATFYFTLGSK